MKRLNQFTRLYALAIALATLAFVSPRLTAQAAGRMLGTVTAINGNTLSVKTDAGAEQKVTVPDSATLKRLAPGSKDLAGAPAIPLSDVAVGDRVLIKLDPSALSATASLVVAMKQADLVQVHQKDAEAWQRGISGLVKKVDPASGDITVTTGAGPTAKTVTVKTTGATKLLRYAPDSARYADAKPAPIDQIKTNDQLRARGAKNADGSEITADEVVSGTFRHIAGTIQQVDASANTITVKDLATKKPVTIHFAQDVQLRRIPEHMAQMLAMRLKGQGGTFAAGPRPGAPSSGAPGSGQGQGSRPGGPGSPAGAPGGAPGGFGGSGMGGDPQRFLTMAPAIKLADLQKNEAVMIVATDGANDVNAITLLAGVEPLLEAPAATDLLSNWSMGSGGAEAAAGPQ